MRAKWASIVFAFIVFLLSLGIVAPVYAGTITVDTLTDGTGVAGCSLREAITQANAGVDGDGCAGVTASPNTINLSVSGSYTLTTGSELTVNTNITIQESSGATAIIEAATTVNTAAYSVFVVDGASAALTLSGVTVRNGGTTVDSLLGGCISSVSGGDVTLTGGTVVEDCRNGINGGAIFAFNSAATFTITNSTVRNNISGGHGAAIMCGFCVLTLNGATISGNLVDATLGGGGGGTYGGGIFCVNCTLNVSGSTFANNQLNGQSGLTVSGGALMVNIASGTATITTSTFSNNSITSGASRLGGAIATLGNGTLNISNSVFTGNSVSGFNATGGALYAGGGALNVTNSRIESNSSSAGTVGVALGVSGSATTASITGSCIVNNGDTAIADTDATNITTATGNWWGTEWGPRIAGVTGSQYSNGDSINGNGTSAVDVGWTNGGDENFVPPTGNWITVAPTVAGQTCMTCTEVSSVGHGRTCS